MPPKMLCTGGKPPPAGGRDPNERPPALPADAKVKPALLGDAAAPPKPPKPLLKPPPELLPAAASQPSEYRTGQT